MQLIQNKFWHGAKKFEDAIDQLLGYLTWRDRKCSLVIFDWQKNASAIVQKMHEKMAASKGHRKSISHDPTGNGRYVFVTEIDPGRENVISTLRFDIREQP